MTKPNTVQDLLGSQVSERDLDRMACRLFNNTREMAGVIDGYVVTMPDYVTLPDSCKQFIRKALVFATVTNILEVNKIEEIDHEEMMGDEDYDADAKAFDKIVDEHYGE